eukprot:1161302-Pelagomonas_calceolata.AAC.4
MKPPESAVTHYAIEYIGVRAWGIPAVLAGFVAIGTYRGFKVRMPMLRALVSQCDQRARSFLWLE